jgi:NitT/TauT family transport system permease protein
MITSIDGLRRFRSALLILGLFATWELLCLLFQVSDLVLPRPSQIAAALVTYFPALLPHALQTLSETIIGFVIGVLAGALLGILVGWSKTAYDVTYPIMVGFASVPKIAVVPIFVLWFGSGFVPAVLTAAVICLFPVMVNIAAALATTEPELEGVAPGTSAKRRHSKSASLLLRLAQGCGNAGVRRKRAVRDDRLEPRHW